MAEEKFEPLKLKNPDVAAKYDVAFPDEQKDAVIRVPGLYGGPLSGITLEAADAYIEKQKGNLLRKKAAASGSTALSIVKDK